MVLGAFKKLAILAAVLTVSSTAALQPNAPYYNEKGILQIGTTELLNVTVNAGANKEHTISYPGASYISVKFANVNLPEGDVLIVRSPDSTDGHVYMGKGRANLGTFVSSPVKGSTAIVEYFSLNSAASNSAVSYQIPGYVRGFGTKLEAICGADDTKPIKCASESVYNKSKAVARLLIGGSGLCTGWLVGSSGHLITNQHCITQASDAAQVDIEFMAESSSCEEECATELGCRGTVEAQSAKFVTNSEGIDYALLKLDASLATKYGFFQFRASGPKVNEKIYIPQHPAGWAKRVSTVVDGGAPATITFTKKSGTVCGNNQVGYMADTQGGASGSPVVSQSDNLVVALHHCGGCHNLAVDPRVILADLKRKGISVPSIAK